MYSIFNLPWMVDFYRQKNAGISWEIEDYENPKLSWRKMLQKPWKLCLLLTKNTSWRLSFPIFQFQTWRYTSFKHNMYMIIESYIYTNCIFIYWSQPKICAYMFIIPIPKNLILILPPSMRVVPRPRSRRRCVAFRKARRDPNLPRGPRPAANDLEGLGWDLVFPIESWSVTRDPHHHGLWNNPNITG